LGEPKEDLVKSLVVYESMYGNTHHIATAIAEGLSEAGEASVLPVDEVKPASLEGVDLLVVGAPTHAHGLSRPSTRRAAADAVEDPAKGLTLDPDAGGPGIREWFQSVGDISCRSAAFDTRIDMPSVLTGRASRGIAKQLRQHGAELVSRPESFLVDRTNHLVVGEDDRAVRWGAALVRSSGLSPATAV
jgi:hypothetical protein